MSRTRNGFFVVLLAVLLATLALTGCSSGDADPDSEPAAESEIKVGDMVAAEWTPSSLYLAEVTTIEDDGSMTVIYQDDQSEAVVAEEGIFPIVEKEWAVGDRVLAVWAVAKFYSGTIEEVEGEEYIVSWDDGSDPSAVAADQIIAYEEQYADEPVE
jgi:hypothetical protein